MFCEPFSETTTHLVANCGTACNSDW